MADSARRTRRLFVGIELDSEARAACAAVAEALSKSGFAAKYEAPEKLHATLAFLGNVDASRYDEIASALVSGVEGAAPFAVTLDKLGAFPHERRPRVVYVGSREQGRAFRSLGQNVRGVYAALGFSFADDAVAHVTIARVKESKRPLPLVEFAPVELDVHRIALFESLFDKERKTSRYEIAAAIPL